MIEILWLGRGGQGAFTAAKLLGAAYTETIQNYALAFPSFGPERRGAPVRAFTKLDSKPILNRSEIQKADFIVILDETLYTQDLQKNLKPNGKIIVNSHSVYENVISYHADAVAKELHLPVVNTIMLGVLAGLSGIADRNQLENAVRKYMPEKLHDKNMNAIQRTIQEVAHETLFA